MYQNSGRTLLLERIEISYWGFGVRSHHCFLRLFPSRHTQRLVISQTWHIAHDRAFYLGKWVSTVAWARICTHCIISSIVSLQAENEQFRRKAADTRTDHNRRSHLAQEYSHVFFVTEVPRSRVTDEFIHFPTSETETHLQFKRAERYHRGPCMNQSEPETDLSTAALSNRGSPKSSLAY